MYTIADILSISPEDIADMDRNGDWHWLLEQVPANTTEAERVAVASHMGWAKLTGLMWHERQARLAAKLLGVDRSKVRHPGRAAA